ncbi:MAG: hypothetical protein JRH20_31225 [Deltaproteobacteria bacterium]|nr:hypothetical protein [Deltaproteobacteria bacterium]
MRGLFLLLLTLVVSSSCVVGQMPKEPFLASSLDKNGARYHQLLLDGGVRQISGRLITLAKEREMVLVQQRRCGAKGCELAFRSKPVDRRVLRGTSSRHLSYYSRYFFRLVRKGDKVEVSSVGLPVLDGRMACPQAAKPLVTCRLEKLTHHRNKTLVASVRAEWGYDVSGQNEAELLTGMLAELPRAAASGGRGRGRAILSPSVKGMIVAVFDIEDRVGLLDAKTRGQLTEYLAAGVTRFAGYQVVPRDQLRRRLAAEKRKSYKLCVEQRCQIELGKAVAAKKSLATKLLKVGKQCAFTALLYDLRTETTERAAQVRTACDQDALLGGVEKLAKQLAGVE